MVGYNIIALFIIFVLLLLAMRGRLMALVVIALMIGDHLNDRGQALGPAEETVG